MIYTLNRNRTLPNSWAGSCQFQWRGSCNILATWRRSGHHLWRSCALAKKNCLAARSTTAAFACLLSALLVCCSILDSICNNSNSIMASTRRSVLNECCSEDNDHLCVWAVVCCLCGRPTAISNSSSLPLLSTRFGLNTSLAYCTAIWLASETDLTSATDSSYCLSASFSVVCGR